MYKKSCTELFLELAKPNTETGISRWVNVQEFAGNYSRLQIGNGLSWGRKNSSLNKKYIIEKIKENGKIIKIRVNGYNNKKTFSQKIRKDIADKLRDKPCVFTGVFGNSENTTIEIDHKCGQKNEERVSNIQTQKEDDFQPTCKALNNIKRQKCKMCMKTGIRPCGCSIPGNILKYYAGNESLKESGCVGCYYYDPVKYRTTQLAMARKGEI